MKPVKQRIFGPSKGPRIGDCFKCCIASVLELPYEEVPHFVAGEWKVNGEIVGCDTAANDWMRTQGYKLRLLSSMYFADWKSWTPEQRKACEEDPTLAYAPREYPLWMPKDHYWIATVVSRNIRGSCHAIVMNGTEVAWDPSPIMSSEPYRYVGDTLFVAADPSVAVPREKSWLQRLIGR